MDPYNEHDRKVLSPVDVPKTPDDEERVAPPEAVEEESGIERDPTTEEETGDETTLIDHLSELRGQLMKSALVFLTFLILVFSTIHWWFPFITKGEELVILGPLEVIKFYSTISFALALGLSLPWVIHFLWQFVAPGLEEKEASFLKLYAPVMGLLFIGGLAFGFYVVHPLSYHFLLKLGAINFDLMITAEQYVTFLLFTTLPLGFLFELPVAVLFLASIGLITSDNLTQARKWAYVTIAVVSAVITPPDFISQLIVLIPMAILYEASVAIVKRMERAEQRKEATE
ncbi:twin-arginine translocase subunit TatC [Planococcaceae bacterium Storch 2/2-2]|nr:twin-arginine translocase subunit TatC [Planococcaceae bacterium Storch 2/2-2]